MLHLNEESRLPAEKLGEVIPPFRPTYPFASPYIDRTHREIGSLPLQDGALIAMKDRRWFGRVIPGWLRPADALKLYEMAFFADGEILELGSFHGLSTAILAKACRNSAPAKRVHSVDLDPNCSAATRATLRRLGLERFVTLQSQDATSALREMADSRRTFAFVFVDHSHAYQPVLEVCRLLHRILQPGGFCLFHDYNDIRNQDASDGDYGVYQAILDGLNPEQFTFYGIFGCTGLYRREPDAG